MKLRRQKVEDYLDQGYIDWHPEMFHDTYKKSLDLHS